VMWRSLGLTAALLAAVWVGAERGIAALLPALSPDMATLVHWATGFILAFGLGFLVAPVTTIFAGLFLDEVAEAVERESYPADPPGRPQTLIEGLKASARFTALVLAVNGLLLLLIWLPGINLPLFFVVNAYLIGREYFEFAALRFSGPDEVRALRQFAGGRIFLAGLMVALLLAIPLLNLLTPLFAAALMVHLHKAVARDYAVRMPGLDRRPLP